MSTNPDRLRRFIVAATRAVDGSDGDEATLLAALREPLAQLVAVDDWLPDRFAEAASDGYRQHLLHCDPLERFCVVSFVWGPGQATPVHDHTVWGLIGMLRGAELSERFSLPPELRSIGVDRLEPGMVDAVSPSIGDVHRVSNAYADRVSVSVHVYGGNIGRVRRHVFDTVTGAPREFVSGYANTVLPNIWAATAP